MRSAAEIAEKSLGTGEEALLTEVLESPRVVVIPRADVVRCTRPSPDGTPVFRPRGRLATTLD
ncbi:MAG: hypothetical protein PXZ08_11085 [Actinomycetota bacterium]|nr:hypothetical protein [Actinomycetota bacterium]